MADIGKAYVQIVPSSRGLSGAISEQLGAESEKAGKSTGLKISTMIRGALASAGIGKALIETLREGGKLEQSLGGIETLFKENANRVKQYAKDAYKTTGLSANAYMENVTGFSASLLQSLGGDTKKAAEISNMAMIDMADNSNKMGTSMESIQYAYQGFAKQNYTMLDNLKLGYGGTKSEMERLLSDAEKLTGVKYDINNLSDVYNAIHAIQGKLDITGTTAKEASETLTGSFNSMKASFQDVLGNLSTGGDVTGAFNNLKETVVTFVSGNLIPAISNVLKGVWGILTTSLNEALPGFGDSLNSIVESVTTIFNAITTVIEETLNSELFQTIFSTLATIIASIVTDISSFISYISELLINFGLLEPILAGVVASFIAFKTAMLVTELISIFNTLITASTTIFGLFNAVLLANPLMWIAAAIGAVVAAGVLLYKHWDVVKQYASSLWQSLLSIFTSIKTFIVNIWTSIKTFQENNVNAIKTFLINIWNGIKTFLLSVVTSISTFISSKFSWVQSTITSIFNGVKTFISSAWGAIKSTITGAINTITSTCSNMLNSMFSIGENLVTGLWNGISSVFSWIKSKIGGFCQSIVSSIKSFFGIHSPSKVFAEIGEFLDLGLAEGITDNLKPVSNAMDELSSETQKSFESDLRYNISSSKLSSSLENSYDEDKKVKENKPLMLNLVLGGKEFKAFVEDITKLQEDNINLNLSYR